MRVLFDVNHPAQVHLFRHAVEELQSQGHETLVTSREKEMTVDLLDAYGIDHVPLTRQRSGMVSLAAELAAHELRLLRVARRFDPDVLVGRYGPAVVHVSRLLGRPNLLFRDSSPSSGLIPTALHRITAPFVTAVATPPEYEFDVLPRGARRHVLGLQELAYLHPNRFEPDPSVLRDHGVDPDERFAVFRFVGWEAYHDIGHAGLSIEAKRDLIEYCKRHGSVYVSSEADPPEEFDVDPLPVPPHLAHHLLAHADLYAGDSGTMATEAAVLGTPAVRANTMVDRKDEYNFRVLEEEYDLLNSYADEGAAIERAKSLFTDEGATARWARRRERLLADHPDATDRIVELIRETVRESGSSPESEPESESGSTRSAKSVDSA